MENFITHYHCMRFSTGSILMMITGIIGAWTSPMLQKLNGTEDNPLQRVLTENESSWLASIPILGSIVGSFLFGGLAQLIGRKPLLTTMALPYLLFFVIMLSSKVFWLQIIARIFGGVGAGGVMSIIPVYICEVAISQLRGRLISLMFVALNVGTLVTFCLAPYISFHCYHLSLSILPLSLLILIPIFATESPYSILHTDPMPGEKILKKVRGKYDVTKELNQTRKGIIQSAGGGLINLFSIKGTKEALIIALGLGTFLMCSGSVAILSFINFIVDAAGGVWLDEVNTIILGIVQLITSTISSAIVDRFSRKLLLTISYLGVALSQLVLGGYFVMKNNGVDTTGVLGWIPILSLISNVIAFNFQITLGGLIVGEIFPSRVKNLANAVCSVYTALVGFVIIFFFQRVQKAIGLGQCFWIFGGFGICASIFIKTMVVETKGKTLGQIQDDLNGIQRTSYNRLEKTMYGAIDYK